MTERDQLSSLALLTYPMHGQRKLLSEGYRTRDGHLIEWFGRHLAGAGRVGVVSRPEPAYLPHNTPKTGRLAENTVPLDTAVWRLPPLRDRRRWWVTSASSYPRLYRDRLEAPAVVWNPFVAEAGPGANPFASGQPTVLDLLDDWTVHFAFQSISAEVNRAYAAAFAAATVVTANAEGTVELAKRFGRDDVIFLPNGVDPQRFRSESRATGPLTVGYVGKIGKRLDLDLILDVARALPDMHFIFAGPILDGEYRKPLESLPNIELLGDVHYDDVPELLTRFDVGWVPHNVGVGEVGGDVIKTYEYRAAGLLVLSTPIEGADKRGLTSVAVVDRADQLDWLRAVPRNGNRVERELDAIPSDATWEVKSRQVLERLDLLS